MPGSQRSGAALYGADDYGEWRGSGAVTAPNRPLSVHPFYVGQAVSPQNTLLRLERHSAILFPSWWYHQPLSCRRAARRDG